MKFTAILFAITLYTGNLLAQESCLIQDVPLEVRKKEANKIVYAEVISQFATFDDDQRSIYTLNKLLVIRGEKSANKLDTIWVVTEGGQVGQFGRTVIGAAHLNVGQISTFLLSQEAKLHFKKHVKGEIYRIAYETLGIILDESTVKYDVNKRSSIIIDSFSPKIIIGGMQTLNIYGQGFGNERGNSYVSFTSDGTNYFSSAQAQGFTYKLWSDNKIILEMPQAFSGKIRIHSGNSFGESVDILRVNANVGTVSLNPRDYFYLVNQNQAGGYTWNIHGSFYKDSSSIRCIESVFKEFRCKTGVNYKLSRKPVWVGANLGDGVNTILYDSVGYELPNGVVAFYEQLWYSCILGNYTFYYVMGQELRISRKFNYYYGKGKLPQNKNAKLSYVLFHELGHSLQLGHVNEEGESMHPVVQNLPADIWNERDTLTTYDVIAGKYMVDLSKSFSFRACNVTPMADFSQCENIYEESSLNAGEFIKNGFKVYPNPIQESSNLITIENDLSIEKISIYTHAGNLIYQQGCSSAKTSFSIEYLSLGSYFIVLETIDGIKCQKLLVQ